MNSNIKKEIFSGYAATYNNLDNLCWSIPTRVFTVDFAFVAFVASIKEISILNTIAIVNGLVGLAIVNFLGAWSLSRLWHDQVLMGFKIKLIDLGNGYFRTRHNEADFDTWKKDVYNKKFKLGQFLWSPWSELKALFLRRSSSSKYFYYGIDRIFVRHPSTTCYLLNLLLRQLLRWLHRNFEVFSRARHVMLAVWSIERHR